MEQIGSVDEYFTNFLPYAERFDDSTALKLFLNGLATYIHREIVFYDPKTLHNAVCLAKFYEERWMNLFSEISKPEIQASTIQFHQFQKKFSNDSTISEAENPTSTIQNSKIDPDLKIQTQIHIQCSYSNQKTTSSSLEIQEEKEEKSDTDSTDKSNATTTSTPNSEIQSLQHQNHLQHQQSSCQRSEILDEKEVATELTNSSEQLGNSLNVEEEEQTVLEEDCNHGAEESAIAENIHGLRGWRSDREEEQRRDAAVFPWNRGGDGEEWSSACWQWSAEAEYSANAEYDAKDANRVRRCFEVVRSTLEIGPYPARTAWVSSSTATTLCDTASTTAGNCWGRSGDEAPALDTVVAGRRGGAGAPWYGGNDSSEVAHFFFLSGSVEKLRFME
ncbi:hypothetical protein PIB30_026681 [Stylosanthes scabra]|uniref:Uncharacterized protein n=1 Tax=Stylosanthes scabra TaxID=79078 RepID=A0ABU6QA03_9FABA|nr:hypothetical protein [Stylosanthes scabra]